MKRKISTSTIVFAIFYALITIAHAQTRNEQKKLTGKWASEDLIRMNNVSIPEIKDWIKSSIVKPDFSNRITSKRLSPHSPGANGSIRERQLSAADDRKKLAGKAAVHWPLKNKQVRRIRKSGTRPAWSARISSPLEVPAILHVNYRATGTGDGSSWENAILELADALVYAKDNPGVEQIWVSYGIYWPLYLADYTEEDLYDRQNVFLLQKDIKIYGGFAGNELSLAERDLKKSNGYYVFGSNADNFVTILSGDLRSNDFEGDDVDPAGDNALHVVLSVGDMGSAGLDGVVISGGNADSQEAGSVVDTYSIPGNVGGGIAAIASSPALTNVIICQNKASDGSAIYGSESNFVMTNTLVANNLSSNSGTLYLISSSPVITNVTITANDADISAAGLFSDASNPQVRNSIIYANGSPDDPEVVLANSGAPVFQFSVLKGSRDGANNWKASYGTDGGNNLDTDPEFFDVANGLFSPRPIGPAVNSGNNDFFNADQIPNLSGIVTDLSGAPRVFKTTIDRGALENLIFSDLVATEGIIYVKEGGSGLEDGSSWENAAAEVADALVAAKLDPHVLEIWVAGGTYFPRYHPITFANDNVVSRVNAFVMVDGTSVYGGFAGTESTREQRDLSIVENATILSADFSKNDNYSVSGFASNGPDDTFAENAFHLIYAFGMENYGAAIDGFTIEGANTLSDILEGDPDGDLSLLTQSVMIKGVAFPIVIGSGIVSLESSILISNVVLRNNFGFFGGSLLSLSSETIVLNSAMYHNFGFSNGGGISSIGSYLSLKNTTVTENFGTGGVGGVYISASNFIVANSIVHGNFVLDNFDMTDVDFAVEQQNDDSEEAIFDISIANSLIGGSGGSDNWVFSPEMDGGGNLDEDPAFKDVNSDDFSLSACSRAIDAGDNAFFGDGIDPNLPPIIATIDLAGNARIFNATVDMGAYELQSLQSAGTTELAGNGKESYLEFTNDTPQTFIAQAGVCQVDLLTLKPLDLMGDVTAKVWVDSEVHSYNGAVYLQRHYDVSPDENAENATARLTLYFTQTEFNLLNEQLPEEDFLPTGVSEGEDDRKANFRIYQFHGPSIGGSGNPSSYESSRTEIDPEDEDIIWNETLQRWEVGFDVNGFSGFFAGTASQSPLPVRLVSFEGKLTENQKVKLDWRVAEQENIDSYIVEHSGNGNVFTEVGRQAANVQPSTHYSFIDGAAHSGDRAYYRLKIVEMDGKTAYSRLISVKLPAGEGMVAYPVPARNELWIDWKKSEIGSVDFIDPSGKILKTVTKTSDSQKVDISGIPAGLFLIKAEKNNVLKVVKE